MKKEITTLAVSEVFYSIQGEGQTMGIPAVFLRLGGCNLLCKSDTWVCDTIEVWSKSKAIAFENVLPIEYVKKLRNGAHLVITGGEPLLHQKAIEAYLEWFSKAHFFTPIIEVETNGSIRPAGTWIDHVHFWNVSPKLKSAGDQNAFEKRFNEEALIYFASKDEMTIFKFVVADEGDVLEIHQDFGGYIQTRQVVFMPAGSSQEELSHTRLFVAEKCRELNLRYSDRLHVVIWNLKTGV
jgi:7-carboxy-7-deazaguanine synthase